MNTYMTYVDLYIHSRRPRTFPVRLPLSVSATPSVYEPPAGTI